MFMRSVATLALCAGLLAHPAPVAAQQTLNFTLGAFTVHGEDARVEGDVLNANRNFLLFDIGDFNTASVGAEWLVPLNRFVEAGAGIGFSRRTVSSSYADFVNTDGSEIEQDLRLRLVPVAFTLRVVPTGQDAPVQPYFGGGLGLFAWRYAESGEFVDFANRNAIFREQYVASGSETGPVVLGGVRFVGDTVTAGGEVRFHDADADLGADFPGSNPRIDLGGWTYQFTLGIRFGR